jgi:hypothetical protein
MNPFFRILWEGSMKRFTLLYGLVLSGCLDPNISVEVSIERADESSSSAQPSSEPSGQPANEPSGQPSNEPSGQPSNEPSGQPSNEPSGQPSNEPSGQPSNEPSGQPSNEPSGQPSNEPSGQPSNEPSGQPSNEGGGGSSSSFDAAVCEEWLSCATNSTDPGIWATQYGTIEAGCFNNHNSVSDSNLVIWFECVESSTGDCSAVLACGEPVF